MKCKGCGLSLPFPKVTEDRRCTGCGNDLQFTSDDFLLHGANNLIKSVRTGQVEMARLIETLIENSSVGIIEGPVGIGKSFAYTIPAILSGKRIVISTAKKQLQHQLFADAPRLATHLEKEGLGVALLKGKSNYACLDKLNELDPGPERQAIEAWLLNAKTGDIVEATDHFGRRPKQWFEMTAEDCVGARCKFSKRCGYWRSKQQAKVAQVIIANHYVVAFDLKFGPYKILPQYDVLVIDEAHQAPAAMRGAFAQTVTPFGVKRIIQAIDKVGLNTGHEKRLEDLWKQMFEAVKNVEGEVGKDPFGAAGDEAILILEAINKMATAEKKEAGGGDDSEDMEESEATFGGKTDWDALVKIERLKRLLARQLEALRSAKQPDDNTVVYVTTAGGGDKRYKTVNVAPISVGPMIGSKFTQIPTTIITSATLSVNGKFDDIKRQLGLDYEERRPAAPTQAVGMAQAAADIPPEKKVETLVLESPFDYRRQAVLYTPKHMPLPVSAGSPDLEERRKYINALATEIARLLRASEGNAFILFSATSDMVDVQAALEEEDLKGVTLIPQGDDAEAAFGRFKNTPKSAILGLKSFWEGVDVQGDKLRLVIITKLPFPMPSEPVFQARARVEKKRAMDRGMGEREADGIVFRILSIPSMITDLRQGVGRLIRSTTDRGVCAILDPRIWTGSAKKKPAPTQLRYEGYGITTINALGFAQRTSDITNVAKFLAAIKATEKL